MPTVLPDAGANRRNLGRLCLLRTLLLVALLAAAGLLAGLQAVPVHRDGGLQLALALLAGFNLWTFWRLRQGGAVGERELFLQLVVDVLLVALVLYRTGGSTNPFVSYFLVPLTITAATLRPAFTVGLAMLTLAAYSLLLSWYLPFPPFSGLPGTHAMELVPVAGHHHPDGAVPLAGQGDAFNLHVFGMWMNFVLSAGLIAFFVTRMSSALREQDRLLAEQQQHLLQREQVLALGAMAAGAAHELGTPLATMSVIAGEIEAGLPADSPLREEAVLLRQQLGQCRRILQGLRERANGGRQRQQLSVLIREVVNRMELIHPRRCFVLELALLDREVAPPETLSQVLVNLLDNAAQAARMNIVVRVAGEADDCIIDIRDDGPGIAPEIAERLGQPFVSSREDGLGIGYFLSHANVNAWGGSIHLQPGEAGGLEVRLRLPWRVLAVSGEGDSAS